MTATRKSIFSIEVEAPPEHVWQKLTEPGARQPFYFNSVLDIDPKPGGPLCYRSASGSVTFIVGEVVAFEPPRRFEHTFRFTDLADPVSTVAFELSSTDTGTRVTVTHVGSEDAAKTFARVRRGWPSILSNLQCWTGRGRLPLKAKAQNALMGLMLPFFPKPKHTPRDNAG